MCGPIFKLADVGLTINTIPSLKISLYMRYSELVEEAFESLGRKDGKARSRSSNGRKSVSVFPWTEKEYITLFQLSGKMDEEGFGEMVDELWEGRKKKKMPKLFRSIINMISRGVVKDFEMKSDYEIKYPKGALGVQLYHQDGKDYISVYEGGCALKSAAKRVAKYLDED